MDIAPMFTSHMVAWETNQSPPYAYGKYHITARAGDSIESLTAQLPTSVPMEVQFFKKGSTRVLTSGIVDCPVSWRGLSSLVLEESQIIKSATEALVIPADTVVQTPLGSFVLDAPLGFTSPYTKGVIHLVIHVLDPNKKANVVLQGDFYEEDSSDTRDLALAFFNKPTGATAITTFSLKDGDTQWTALGDISANINEKPAAPSYGLVSLLDPNTSPYSDYLKGDIDGFLISLVIKGGVYDGETVILPWPEVYEAPFQLPDIEGSGGNENNSGTGNGESNDGGQRPELPDNSNNNSSNDSASNDGTGNDGAGNSGSGGEPSPPHVASPEDDKPTLAPDMATEKGDEVMPPIDEASPDLPPKAPPQDQESVALPRSNYTLNTVDEANPPVDPVSPAEPTNPVDPMARNTEPATPKASPAITPQDPTQGEVARPKTPNQTALITAMVLGGDTVVSAVIITAASGAGVAGVASAASATGVAGAASTAGVATSGTGTSTATQRILDFLRRLIVRK